jgi:hypothetical protein
MKTMFKRILNLVYVKNKKKNEVLIKKSTICLRGKITKSLFKKQNALTNNQTICPQGKITKSF